MRTIKEPPKHNTLQEWVLLLLLNRLEDLEHAKLKALAQAIVDKEKGIEAYDDYLKVAFPGLENRRKQQNGYMTRALNDWVKQGPLKVAPMSTPQGKSRLKKRLVKVENERMDRLYRKL